MNIESWLESNIIFEAIMGSHAYGLNTPESDEDFRGVCIAPKDYYLGLYHFEQLEEKAGKDRVVHDIKKFVMLAKDCNPNIIEYLFAPEDCIVKTTKTWEKLQSQRHLFLTKKAKFTYSGYAFAQLKRIKTHRAWLLNPPVKKPERADYGLPTQEKLSPELIGAIDKVIRDTLHDELIALFDNHAIEFTEETLRYALEFDVKNALTAGFADFALPQIVRKLETNPELSLEVGCKFFSDEIMSVYDKEKRYRQALSHWKQYEDWKRNRNEKRAELEAKFGYDTKHAQKS